MATQSSERTKVFICYSHGDALWLQRLRVHLRPLEREHRIEIWDDTRIKPGSEWRKEITRALATTKIAVLLVSADFLASDFIAGNELPTLLAAAEEDGAVILPVILSPSRFLMTGSLERFQAVNDPHKPLIGMARSEQESVLVKVTEAIEALLDSLPKSAATQLRRGRSQGMPSRTKTLKLHSTAVLILIGGVITGYLHYNVRSKPDRVRTVSYTGRVRNGETGHPIHKAKVSIEEGQKVPQVQETDSEGVFHVNLPETTEEVHVLVEASGYTPSDRRVSLTRTGVEDIQLQPNVMPTPKPSPSPLSSSTRRRRHSGRPAPSKRTPRGKCSLEDVMLGQCELSREGG